jgi:hypothetical protein
VLAVVVQLVKMSMVFKVLAQFLVLLLRLAAVMGASLLQLVVMVVLLALVVVIRQAEHQRQIKVTLQVWDKLVFSLMWVEAAVELGVQVKMRLLVLLEMVAQVSHLALLEPLLQELVEVVVQSVEVELALSELGLLVAEMEVITR